MSGPKRTPLERPRKEPILAEMVSLWKRGRELQAQGHDDALADHPDDADPYWEFRAIDKKLRQLLRRGLHEVSVFDRGLGEHFDAEPPDYMQARNSVTNPDFNGWKSAQRIALALEAALAAQGKRR